MLNRNNLLRALCLLALCVLLVACAGPLDRKLVTGQGSDAYFASLNPVLYNKDYPNDQRLDAAEIMAVRKLYQEWWDEYGHQADPEKLPLEGTVYIWR